MTDLADAELTALLGRGTQFEGKLCFEGRLRIDGHFKGSVKSDGILVIGDDATIEADIDAAHVIIRGGTVEGEITASQSIELHVPAKVTGNLQAPEIFMDKGVEFKGACKIVRE